MYNLEVNRHFMKPLNAGNIEKEKVSTTVMIGSPQEGAVIKLQLEVKNNRIINAKFKAYGAVAIACMSWLTERVKGLSLQEALKIESMTISEELDLPSIKLFTCFIAIDALQLAIKSLI